MVLDWFLNLGCILYIYGAAQSSETSQGFLVPQQSGPTNKDKKDMGPVLLVEPRIFPFPAPVWALGLRPVCANRLCAGKEMMDRKESWKLLGLA